MLTTALAAYWRKHCQPHTLGLFKPVQTGLGDRELYSRLFGLEMDEITPLHFQAPLAPAIAARLEKRHISLDVLWRAFEAMQQCRDFVLVEGLGGLGSPITEETTVADLAWDWRLPAVLVVPVKLGAIGQTVANVALARQCRVHLKGIVLNCAQPCTPEQQAQWAPVDLIQSLTSVPILGSIPHVADPTDLTRLVQVASDLDLERLLPLGLPIPVG